MVIDSITNYPLVIAITHLCTTGLKKPVAPLSPDHGGETGGLGEVGDDLAALDARIVVLVDEERLDDDEDLVDVGPDQVVELVEDAVDDLDEQVALLVLERGRHEQGQDLVEEGAGAQLARLVRDLAQRRLAHGRRACRQVFTFWKNWGKF